jgi:hypothetical protein
MEGIKARVIGGDTIAQSTSASGGTNGFGANGRDNRLVFPRLRAFETGCACTTLGATTSCSDCSSPGADALMSTAFDYVCKLQKVRYRSGGA